VLKNTIHAQQFQNNTKHTTVDLGNTQKIGKHGNIMYISAGKPMALVYLCIEYGIVLNKINYTPSSSNKTVKYAKKLT
jgi:hypothetical protein